MMIIVEGVDCSGKSTLSTYLLKNLKNSFLIRRGSIPKNNQLTEIGPLKQSYKTVKDIYKKCIKPNKAHLIVERFYPSEIVYSKVKRGYEGFDDRFYQSFEEELIEEFGKDIILLFVFFPIEGLIDRISIRGDDYIDKEDLKELNDRYLEFLNKTKLNVFSVRGDNDCFENALEFIHINLNIKNE